MSEYLPELAIADDYASESFEPDDEGVYTIVKYKRKDDTLYMKSTLSYSLGKGMYRVATLTYYDKTGTIPLHSIMWELEYDINSKIVGKKVVL